MKKAAYKYAQETKKRMKDEISADEEEEPCQAETDPSCYEPPLVPEPRWAGQCQTPSSDADSYREYKTLKNLVREKRSEETTEEYIKDLWPMVNSSTDCDAAKKLWLGNVTANPVGKGAQNHYERLVLEDMDDEDSQIQRAKVRMDQGQPLTSVWYQIKQTIPPRRYVKALRVVTKGRRGEPPSPLLC